MLNTDLIFQLINIIGTVAFAVSGYLVGFRKRLDILGVVIVALLTAVGGGMMRDALIGHIPMIFKSNTALWTIFITLLLSWAFHLQYQRHRVLAIWFVVADALGLAAFSLTGAQVGLALELNWFGVVTLAFVTAVGGGILRDILVNEVPIILRSDIYGTIAILLGLLLCLLDHWKMVTPLSINLLFISGVISRLLAYHYHVTLPGFQKKKNYKI
ncbi:MAG: trimeric intracellular cation channel family protein [Snodgrassella sp.]|uniref:Glycine transporter domain-containing protein n=1 Tax=Snodgrassella alvi TaxID=1196083 RepID=A0A2N9XPZ0_9NEIS|nr:MULTISPECIES: trimeric intracellular cation channel family protein [Snodgrassella]MCO6506916.1 trimeric intracellular cation channel family protein [Snodgrassella sp.]MCO6508711.1 trimeric intracellular cation channel family protein [Snodgrassella sp.]MCO6514535.1 trimeric intracellular cation channel family protein [Snodgrassella sp.]MCO6515543.1 trimeric intracellular cation channel family protein [Snodgrassella sp.]MCO6518133.1 trimeric intracellular cation channel family protein [Snodgr